MKLKELMEMTSSSNTQFVRYMNVNGAKHAEYLTGIFYDLHKAIDFAEPRTSTWVAELNPRKLMTRAHFDNIDPDGKFVVCVEHKDSGLDMGCVGPFTTEADADEAAEVLHMSNSKSGDHKRIETDVFPFKSI